MEFISQLLLVIIFFIIVPFLIGSLLTRFINQNSNSIILCFPCGFVALLSIYEVVALPMTFLKCPFNLLVIVWLSIVIGLCIISILLHYKHFGELWHNLVETIKQLPWFAIVVILLILLQAAVLSAFMHIDDDDAFYVGTATTAMHTNTIFEYDPYTGELATQFDARYALSLFPVFCAIYSALTGINVTILMHTVLPAFLIPLAYLVYYLIAKDLFKKDIKKILAFLFFVCILNIFGFASIYTASSFMLFRIWQGKAILASILLPFILFVCMRFFSRHTGKKDWFLMLLIMLASCTVSSMGVFLSPILFGVLVVILSIKNKTPKYIVPFLICCIPNFILGFSYILLRS